MSREGREYLLELVNSVIYTRDAFHIPLGDGFFAFAAICKDTATRQYFDVSAIYDSLCDIDSKIKCALNMALSCNIPESLVGYHPLSKATEDQFLAMYHAENIVFRVSTLWDLLAQLCNVIYQKGVDPNKIHHGRFFKKHMDGENSIPICKEIVDYFEEKDDSSAEINPWPGNHAYLNDFRNQMSHRLSPNITSISTLGITLRPPVMYLLHRAIEDYYKVSSFLCQLINNYLDDCKNWIPSELSHTHEDKHNEQEWGGS